MGMLYVARSSKLGRWTSDVGFGKHVYKLGITEGDPKALAAEGWAGETDWKIVRTQSVEGLSEEEAIERLARKEGQPAPRFQLDSSLSWSHFARRPVQPWYESFNQLTYRLAHGPGMFGTGVKGKL